MSIYVRLGQVISGCQVRLGKLRLFRDMTGYFWLGQVISGKAC
jgi:hypothetical protein